MSGNKIGWRVARQTMKEMDYIKESIESNLAKKEDRERREIKSNQEAWRLTLDYLKKIDQDWEAWYNSPAIPETIYWTGEKFQIALKNLWDRINHIKGVVNEKDCRTKNRKSKSSSSLRKSRKNNGTR